MTLFARLLNLIFPSKIVPLPRTTPVLRGFYGAGPGQVAETKGMVDIHWESFWFGDVQGIARIVEAKLPTVIDLMNQLYEGPKHAMTLRRDAEDNLRLFFKVLQAAGALQYVRWLYPIDEPDLRNLSDADQWFGNTIARHVAREFPELAGVRLMVIFSSVERMPRIGDYDDVMFDAYGEGNKIFHVTLLPWPPMSDMDRLMSLLRPDQTAGICIGPADPWRTDPAEAFAFAEKYGQISIVLSFLYIDRTEPDGTVFKGIRNNGMAKHYSQIKGT